MLIQVDAAQLEWRGAVWLSNDQTGIEEINEKQDIHSINQEAFALPTRTIAKIYLFRTIFRGSGWSFANDSDFSHVSHDPAFWDDVNEKFYKKYHGLNAWHHKMAQTVAARLPIVSPLGREWFIKMTPDGQIPWTTLSNYPVQGTCADIMTVARVTLARRLMNMKHLESVKLVSTVHDSIVLDAPTELVKEVSTLATSCFDDLPRNFKRLWNIDLPIAFPGEVKAGPNLQELEKIV
jgi:DNA polymerase I-like protein with 3'-5' exonuclease and polymerase domains